MEKCGKGDSGVCFNERITFCAVLSTIYAQGKIIKRGLKL